MGNLIVILLLMISISILIFSGKTEPVDEGLLNAYKNKADAFENLNKALNDQNEAQTKLLDEYRKTTGHRFDTQNN